VADTPTSSAPSIWASTIANIDDLHQQLDGAADNTRALEERLIASEEYLLDLQAPDLAGVIRKLELIWEEQLHGQDQVSGQKVQVLDDLRRLAAA
tara:strand:- start:1184 stop:1468 length:285 start_codon:yes stop_codon:yes gene_type:complete